MTEHFERPSSSAQSLGAIRESSFTVEVDGVSECEWSRLVGQFADANFYQTWAYGAVSWNENQLSHCVLKENGQAVALAQLRVVKLPFLGAGVAYLRWGPCCRGPSSPADGAVHRRMLKALVREYVERQGLLLRILPHAYTGDPPADQLIKGLHELGFQREGKQPPYRTIRVDLTAGPDTIRKRLDGKWRNQLNAAERNGLDVVEGTGDELYAQFLGLYNEMMVRKKFDTTVNPEEFRRIQQRLPDAQKMIIMISSKDGVLQTGLVATGIGETGIYLLGATSNDGMKSKGSYLLQWRMMQRLKEQGCRWYDLGGINPVENPGVCHFKRGMGGGEVCSPGCFAMSGSAVSRVVLTAGERLRSLIAKIKR